MKHLLLVTTMFTMTLAANNQLPSWNDGKNKQKIISYVNEVTNEKHSNFIPIKDRIVVFDNDGTLWTEKPIYFQFLFAFDQVKKQASKNPQWKTSPPFQYVLEGNLTGLLSGGEKSLMQIANISHAGINVETFKDTVRQWLKSAKHPTKNKLYTDLVFQPMKELIAYLKANDFDVYVVSGLGMDFMRSFMPELYDIPPNHIIGSINHAHYENGHIIKDANDEIYFLDDVKLKPIGIYHNIGKRPVAVFGNSDGDLAMMQYSQAHKKYKTLQLYIHHTDDKREWAYDRTSSVGKLDKGLDYAIENNWPIVDMKNDWKTIYPKK